MALAFDRNHNMELSEEFYEQFESDNIAVIKHEISKIAPLKNKKIYSVEYGWYDAEVQFEYYKGICIFIGTCGAS